MGFGDGSLWRNRGGEPETGVQRGPGADELAEQLRILANLYPAHAGVLRGASSMLIKQECKIALVRRAMK